MTTRSEQLAFGTAAAGGNVEIYFAVDDFVVIIKSLIVTNLSGASQTYLAFAESSLSAFGVLINSPPVGNAETATWEGWHVLDPGDTVYVSVATATRFDYLLSGTVLPQP